MPETNKSKLQEIPQSVPRALGIVSAVTTNKFVTIRLYDIPSNHAGIRDKEVLFRFDMLPFSTFGVGDAVQVGWKKTTPKDKDTGAFKVQGTNGGCFIRLVEDTKHGTDGDTWLREAARQVKGQVEKRRDRPQNKPVLPDTEKVLRVASSGSITEDVSPISQQFGDLPTESWLPVPVGLPQMNDEWLYDDHYVRIGYVAFTVDSPTEEIRISQAAPFDQVSTIRSRSPIQKNNWHLMQQITFSITLADTDAINRVLLPIIRLFDRAPFIPVFNKLLFEHNITALALQDLQVSTIPGYPNALRAQLVCLSFNWNSYLPAAKEFNGLDSLFCYPLLKIWVEQPRKNLPDYRPLLGRWDGQFAMYHPSENWLDAVSEFPENSERAKTFNEELGLANQIRLWRLSGTPARFEGKDKAFDGFTTATPGSVDREFGEGQVDTLVMSQDVARATVDLTHFANFIPEAEYAFIRIKSRENAVALALHEDCVVVLKQPVILVRSGIGSNTGLVFSRSRWQLTGPDGRIDSIKRTDFLEALRRGEDGVLKALADGQYIFVVYAHTKLIDRIADREFKKLPKDPGDPQTDEENVFDLSTLNIEVVSVSKSNTFAPLQVRGERIPTYHYLGSGPKYFQIAGTIPEYTSVHEIQDFFERATELGRQFRGKLDGTPFGGFILVENELFKLMGVKYVLPLSWSTSTVPNFPGVLRFEMTVVEFDNTQRQREALTDLMRGIELDEIQRKESLSDAPFIRYLRTKEFRRRLRAVELYPDLALPTYTEIRKWLRDIKNDAVWDWSGPGRGVPKTGYEYLGFDRGGTGWQWTIEVFEIQDQKSKIAMLLPDSFLNLPNPPDPNRFADPDFYCAPCQEFGPHFVDTIITGVKQSQLVLHDPYGTSVDDYVPGTLLTEHNIRPENDPAGTVQKGKDAIGKILPIGADSKLIDKINSGQAPAGGQQEASDPSAPQVPYVTPSKEVAGRGTVKVNDGGSIEQRQQHYGPAAAAAALANGVPVDLFFALLEQENHWQMGPRSSKGAIGLGQLLPGTAKELGVDPYDPASNLFGAAKYLAQQLRTFKNKDPQTREQLALAAYNAGAGAVKRANGIPNNTETRNYVKQILINRNKYRNQTTGQGTQYPVSQAEFTSKRQQLLKQFNGGYGYIKSQIEKYIIDPNRPASVPFNKSVEFIKPEWLRTVLDQRVPIQMNDNLPIETAAIHGEIYVVIDNLFINEFLGAAKAKGVSLPLVKVPFRVEGQYAYENGVPTNPIHPPSIQQSFHEPTGGRDMFYDLRRSYIQGRLLNAFPTFYVAIVDGGRALRIYRLYDHVYGMFAITNITVHRTRKGPVETAVVGFANLYGHLTAQAQQTSQQQESDTRHIWNLSAIWRGFQQYIRGIDNEMLAQWAKHLDSTMLKAGARLHIRLGYGSDANDLPIVFNGVITEVPINEGEVQVVALSDGVELTNDLPPTNLQGGLPVTRLNSSFGGGKNPRELIMEYLAPNNFLDTASQYLGKTIAPVFYYNFTNQFGIEHFGQPIRAGLVGFDDGEVGINIYNPEYSTPRNDSSAWESHLRSLQVWKWDKNVHLLGINMHQATPWNIFDTTRKTVPDYILYPVPVDLRSTLFFGKGWFPLFFRYKHNFEDTTIDLQGVEVEAAFDWKPFQQFHFITSDWNLLQNDIRADATDVVTRVQAVGTYNGWLPGDNDLSNECSFLMMLDSDIYNEFQKTVVVESGLYTTVAMKMDEANSDPGGKLRVLFGAILAIVGARTGNASIAIAGIASLLEGPVRSFLLSRRIMDHYAAMVLKDHIKEMYQGNLTILGDGYIKPYDYIGIVDNMSGLNGLAETKMVSHIMSAETGFISVVSPDCIANYMDYDGRDSLMWLATAASHLAVAAGMAHVTGRLSRSLSTYVVLRTARKLRDFVRKDVARSIDPLTGEPTLAPIAKRFQAIVEQDVKNLESALKTNNKAAIKAIFQKFVTSDEYAEIYKSLPLGLKVELRTQYVLRSIAGTVQNTRDVLKEVGGLGGITRAAKQYVSDVGELNKFTRTSKKAASKVTEFVRNQNSKIKDRLSSIPERNVQKYTKQVADAKARVQQFNPEAIESVKDALKSGKNVDEINPAIVKSIRDLESAEAKLAKAVARTTVTTASRRASTDVRRLLAGATSKTGIGIFLSGFFNIAIGGLSDYTLRWAIARQCLTVLPLRIWDKNLEAGINGHRGAVYGDPQVGVLDGWLDTGFKLARDNFFTGLIPILGDVAQEGVTYRQEAIPSILPSHSETEEAE